jgi:enoyl-CoA hydratase/carnithine racemase
LNEQLLRELAGGIGMVAESRGVKLIVLDAAAKVFSAGVDIGEYTASARSPCWTRFTPLASPWSKPRSRCW